MLQEIMVALSCGRARIVVALGVDDENDDDDDVGVEYGDGVVTVAAAPRKRRETMPTDRR